MKLQTYLTLENAKHLHKRIFNKKREKEKPLFLILSEEIETNGDGAILSQVYFCFKQNVF